MPANLFRSAWQPVSLTVEEPCCGYLDTGLPQRGAAMLIADCMFALSAAETLNSFPSFLIHVSADTSAGGRHGSVAVSGRVTTIMSYSQFPS